MNSKNIFLMVLLAALWGPSFVFIKVAVESISPFTLVLGRVGLAALLLYGVLRWQNGRLPRSWQTWKHLTVVALCHNAIPFILFAWGEQYVASNIASILNGTIPLFTILLAHFVIHDDRLTLAKIVGVLIGFVGIVVLLLPTFSSQIVAPVWGVLGITLACFLYAVAIVYSRNHLRGLPPLVAPTGQMIVASLALLPFVLLVDRPWTAVWPSWPSLLSVVGLAVLGTALAFMVYYRLLEQASATHVSMVTYIMPLFGIILGAIFLDESLTVEMALGTGLILIGVFIVNGFFDALRQRWRVSAAHGRGLN